nr:MAG TPA: hypothetical protein [Caudoviricetes sp.]
MTGCQRRDLSHSFYRHLHLCYCTDLRRKKK